MKKFLVLLLMSFSVLSYADEAVKTEDAFTDPNTVIQVSRSNPTVSLRIKSNPTTGYSWFLIDYNPALLKPTAHEYHAPQSDAVGVPGYETWTFSVKSPAFVVPQMTSVTLQSVRPWVVTPNARKMTFSVVIQEKATTKVE